MKILAINPNCSVNVTQTVVAAMRASVQRHCVQVCGFTCTDGPAGIVTQGDFEDAALRIEARAKQGFDDVQAVVIACFSDPGLAQVRQHTTIPIFGLGEQGVRAALALGKRVGVVAVADAAIARHQQYWQRLGVQDQIVQERAVNLPVASSGDTGLAFDRMKVAALALCDHDGADVILLGCAGMSNLRAPLEDALAVPVVDPCAATAQACLAVLDMRGDA